MRCPVRGDCGYRRALHVRDAAHYERQVLFLEAYQLHAAIDLFEQAYARPLFQAREYHLHDGERC